MIHRSRKAFTLVELMVVMGIIGAVLGVSFAGFRYFRREQQLQAAAENIREFLRQARNNARTSSSELEGEPGSEIQTWVYGYAVEFAGQDYNMYKFASEVPGGFPTDDDIASFWDDSNWFESEIKQEYEDGATFEQVQMTSDCTAVGFASVSGKVQISGGSDTCAIDLTFRGSSRSVEVSAITGEIIINSGNGSSEPSPN